MSKLTLLQMTQKVLNVIEGDEVSNIDDTVEAEQIVDIIEDTYFQMVENDSIPELEKLFVLIAATGASTLQIPTDINKMYWLKYDKIKTGATAQDYRPVKYKAPEDFIIMSNSRNEDDSDITAIAEPGASGITLLIDTSKAPEWWTSFDDLNIIFDSYDVAIDASGVDPSKTQCWGRSIPTFTKTNAFTPALDSSMFPLLLAEVKSVAYATIKQELNPKLEKQSRVQKVIVQNDRQRFSTDPLDRAPNFGRRR